MFEGIEGKKYTTSMVMYSPQGVYVDAYSGTITQEFEAIFKTRAKANKIFKPDVVTIWMYREKKNLFNLDWPYYIVLKERKNIPGIKVCVLKWGDVPGSSGSEKICALRELHYPFFYVKSIDEAIKNIKEF